MTRTQLTEILHGHAPVTDAHVDGVRATLRAAVLAAPTPAAALERLYVFTGQELEIVAIHRGRSEREVAFAGGSADGDRHTELIALAGLTR